MASTFVCLSSYFKGVKFMQACAELGNRVILITSESLRHRDWPWDSIDEVFFMEESEPFHWNMDHVIQGFAHFYRTNKVDVVTALDDFDVEKAAQLREVFRIPGMGQTTHRYFRDKLAMRVQAQNRNIAVPAFTSIFNDGKVNQYLQEVAAPFVLKPRSEASATGIKKCKSPQEVWDAIHHLGEKRHEYLLEKFERGDVFHVDSLIYGGEVVFASCSRYLAPPMHVSHDGGVFQSCTLDGRSAEAILLQAANAKVLSEFGMVNGASHTEFIQAPDGSFYFLETSARVGGAHIPEMIEAATGVSIWAEWARLEDCLLNDRPYKLDIPRHDFGGLTVALVKDEHPDTSVFKGPMLYKEIPMDYHLVLVFCASNPTDIEEVMHRSATVIREEFLNILPPSEKPVN